MGVVELDEDEARLLASYANGPRIWDAASVFPLVLRLEAKGLVAPIGNRLYALTAAGRQELGRN